jgi:hypothetical protein
MSFFRMSRRSARTGARSGRLRAHRALAVERLECRRLLDATPLRGEFLVSDDSDGDQTIRDAVAAAARTPVSTIIAFSGRGTGDRDGVFVKRYNAENTVQGGPVLVNTTVNGVQAGASVAGDADGNFVVVWEGEGAGDEHGIFLQRFNAAGERIGDETLVNTTVGGDQHHPTVAMAPDGRFVVAWSGVGAGDFNGVFLRRFDAAGAAQGDEVLVNTHVANQQEHAAVDVNFSGEFIVAWSSRHQDGGDWGVYAQRFADTGEREGVEIAVNSTTASSQMKPSVAYAPAGAAFIAWSSRGQDGSGWGVFSRTVSSSGALDAEMRLSSTTAGHQRDVEIAATPQNEIFAVWQTSAVTPAVGGAGWEVRARVVASGANNAELVVNAVRTGANSGQQWFPSIAANAAGEAVIVWTGEGALDRHGVHGRRYQTSPSGAPVAPVIADIEDREATVGNQLTVEVAAFDANIGDTLTYTLDTTVSPAGATISKNSNNSATIRWTPVVGDLPGPVTFRVIVTDDANPALMDTEDFIVTINPRASAAAARARDEDDGSAVAAVDAVYDGMGA